MHYLTAAQRKMIQSLMEQGIQTDPKTGLQYFTGYEYKALYDWDQYFETLVQFHMGWESKYAINGIHIFLAHQKENGFIPRTTPERPPEDAEHVKPFLARIALLCCEYDGADFLSEEDYLGLKRYLHYWLNDLSCPETGLSIWNSAPHTGMDNQHERAGWWHDCFSQGVDLNHFLYMELQAMAEIAAMKGHSQDARDFLDRAETLKEAINTHLWDEETGFYYDLDTRNGQQIKLKSSCAFSALWAGTASPAQAKRLVEEHLLNEKEFWRPFPIPSYAADEPTYSEEYFPGDLGCGWRANTWIPVNYYTVEGLKKYGYFQVAQRLADITRETVKRLGSSEYYTSESVQKRGLDPFWGWSLLAYFM